MIDFAEFDRRPIIIAIAGSNGAGKTTFYQAHLSKSGLRFVNADVLAAELGVDAYEAARLANGVRESLLARGESFIFETVFSDPVGDKVAFLEKAVSQGYEVVLIFIALSDAEQSVERVTVRTTQGGHDVPNEKLRARFPRTLANLQAAIWRLPHVLIFDNSDLRTPYRHIAAFDYGQPSLLQEPLPGWLNSLIPR